MDEQQSLPAGNVRGVKSTGDDPPVNGGEARSCDGPTRRAVLSRGSKLLVYATPLVQLVRPKQAFAAYGVYS